ncbi:hypothetical protein LKMONMHP_2517 [Methylobacterium organophilum]|uniref:Methyl-accepting transducer domain-containing protein n=2 Tax=Methylobacterium organophilum TaxID=410 RepID=A0ABQ4T7K7_METOR|nr:hypothetical protein LKMONMHP_2517 [Methylobacterium organophilum]
MQIADILPLDRFEQKALLLGGAAGMAAGMAAGTVLSLLDVVQPWYLLHGVAYAGCGGLAVRLLQRDDRAPPRAEEAPAAPSAPPEAARDATVPTAPSGGMTEAAATLAQLDPFFSVTEQQLHSVVTQTETAAGDIIAALQTLDAAQARSAACVARTRDGMVGLAEDGDAALRALAGTLNAYLRDRLESTRAERDSICSVGEQMRSLDALTAGLEKVGASTRMLALNANIEATRAGSHGIGFQVIARELQALAQGSQAAIAQARRQVAAVQQTIEGVVVAARDAERTQAEETRIQTLMADLNGIAERTTRAVAGMAQAEFAEIEALSGQVGEQVLMVFGQVQFQDVVRQQIEAVGEAVRMLHGLLDALRQSLEGFELSHPIQPDSLLEAVRARYVSQVQRETDAKALGTRLQDTETSMIELF